jgi:hypothetical protein
LDTNFLKKLNLDSHFFKASTLGLFKFSGVVIIRFLKILFRRRKNIEVIYLNYSDKHLFETSYIILNYHFKNAIWFSFGKHTTTEKHLKIFNLKNFEKEFDLVVYGFFRKKVFRLKFEPQQVLESDKLKTQFSNLDNDLFFKLFPQIYTSQIILNAKQIKTSIQNKKLQHQKIELQINNYNQTDFI